MADVVPESEEFGNDVPMDPIMEREGSEHSEELEVGEFFPTRSNFAYSFLFISIGTLYFLFRKMKYVKYGV